jgi:hypothetical protein
MRAWVLMAKNSLKDRDNEAHRVGRKFRYAVAEEKLNDAQLFSKFRLLKFDSEAETFVKSCLDEYLTCKQVCLTTIANLLQRFLSMGFTNANGLLNRGQMHVFSTAQFEFLLKEARKACGQPMDRITSNGSPGNYVLLDVGAGDGMVTKKMEPFFDTIYCTEVSTFMCNRLTYVIAVIMDQIYFILFYLFIYLSICCFISFSFYFIFILFYLFNLVNVDIVV